MEIEENQEDDSYQEYFFSDYIDHAILMHRDAHFGGSFEVMVDYYVSGGKGIYPEFEIERIQYLYSIEQKTGRNLAAELLTGSEMEKIGRARDAYKKLRELYEKNDPTHRLPILMADLILSEEEYPEKEMGAIIAKKGTIVPSLLQLVKSPEMHDPLFPGYGLAPALAAKCLGIIGDRRALISLFEMIGEGDFFDEDLLIEALKAIGQPAKEFLLKVLHGRPLNCDNEKAAIALISFKDDPKVSGSCFALLKDPAVLTSYPLSNYIVMICEGLQDGASRSEFKSLAKKTDLPDTLRKDMASIIKSW